MTGAAKQPVCACTRKRSRPKKSRRLCKCAIPLGTDVGLGAVVVALPVELACAGQLKLSLVMLGHSLVEQRAFRVARVVALGCVGEKPDYSSAVFVLIYELPPSSPSFFFAPPVGQNCVGANSPRLRPDRLLVLHLTAAHPHKFPNR